jgi:hypothetical protein
VADVYLALALALFMDMGAGRVMRKLAGTLAWAARGIIVPIPSEEALSDARARLGPAPLRLLFGRTAGLVAGPGTQGAWWRGLHLVALDGTTLDLQDTGANWEHFGGPSTKDASGRKLRGAFPQARVLALAECGTRGRRRDRRLRYRGEDTDGWAAAAPGAGDAGAGRPEFRRLRAVARRRGDRRGAAVADRGVVQPPGG